MPVLQTRACVLELGPGDGPDAAEKAVERLLERGYNTAVVPLLRDGSVRLSTTWEGHLRERRPHAEHLLDAVAGARDLSLWAMVDPLLAGPRGGQALGPFARRHREWLVKNVEGTSAYLPRPEWPALFCWTSLELRRFAGNMLAEAAAGWPLDGVVVDLRALPRATADPRTWTHFGYSCVSGLQRERGFNLEDFLRRPTMEKFRAIDDWRNGELAQFLENMRARVQRNRDQLPMAIVVEESREDPPWNPWSAWIERGVFEECFIAAPPSRFVAAAAEFDALFEEPRPFGFAVEEEDQAAGAAAAVGETAATGFVVLNPGNAGEPLPSDGDSWMRSGALESSPHEATFGFLRVLAAELRDKRRLGQFFSQTLEYLEGLGGAPTYEEAMKLRKDLLRVERTIREAPGEISFDREAVLLRISRLARLLLMTPVPAQEY